MGKNRQKKKKKNMYIKQEKKRPVFSRLVKRPGHLRPRRHQSAPLQPAPAQHHIAWEVATPGQGVNDTLVTFSPGLHLHSSTPTGKAGNTANIFSPFTTFCVP